MSIALFMTCVGGCGSRLPHSDRPWSKATVIVRTDSDPVTEVEVAFLADEGSDGVDAGGVVDAKGTVTFPVLPGDYTVVIRPQTPSPEEWDRSQPGPNAARPRPKPVPGRFQSRKTSPLRATLSAREKREFTFDLAATIGR
jgi:hypothetical protein